MEVKICGLTNLADASVALDAGADYLGFVLYARSPRAVQPDQLAEIVSQLGSGVRAIGVFVNETPERVVQIVEQCGLYAAQIHGDEVPLGFDQMPFHLWRAVWLKASRIKPEPANWPADRYVVDAAVPGQYGGSGVTADWSAAERLAEVCPVMLAGGLTPDNVTAAIRAVHPLGVDVSSGVESSPGHKDHNAVRQFIAAAKMQI